MEEYTPVKVVAASEIPELKLCGLTVGPVDEGREFETSVWVAEELVKAGLARFKDELDVQTLTRIHWGEMVQEVRERALRLFREFLDCRLRKIARLSVSDASEAQLKNMTPEERGLYARLRDEVEKWREECLRFEV